MGVSGYKSLCVGFLNATSWAVEQKQTQTAGWKPESKSEVAARELVPPI